MGWFHKTRPSVSIPSNKKFVRILWALAALTLVLMISGCQTSGAKALPRPASGIPEVTLAARPAKEIQAVARNYCLGRGYVEKSSENAYELVFDKAIGKGRTSKALRVRLRLFPQVNGSWRFVGRPMRVEAWRSDLESEFDVPNGAGQIQGFLAEIKDRIESNR